MKMVTKVVAAAIALAATQGAFAAMTTSGQASIAPNGGGSELLFWVYNVDTGESYVRDLGVRVTDFAPNSTSVPTSGYTYDIGTAAPNGTSSFPGLYASTPPGVNDPGYNVHWSDSTLQGLFGQSFTSIGTTWGVVAASSVAGGSRSLITSNDAAILSATNADGQTIKGQLDGFIGSFNAAPGVDPNILANSKATTNLLADPFNAGNLVGALATPALSFSNGSNVGVSQSFYSIANGASGGLQATYAGLWSLNSDGLLTYEVAAVPEASTWAMFGAGLLLVGAIARRRMA